MTSDITWTNSWTNTGDEIVATWAELTTWTDDVKYATAKALKDSVNVPSVAPWTDWNVLTSDWTDWVSEAPAWGWAWEYINEYTASWAASLTVPLGSAYKWFRLVWKLKPVNNLVEMYCQMSTDWGTTFKNVTYGISYVYSTGSDWDTGSEDSTYITLAWYGIDFYNVLDSTIEMNIWDPSVTGSLSYTLGMRWWKYTSCTGSSAMTTPTTWMNALKFYAETGNMNATFRLYWLT